MLEIEDRVAPLARLGRPLRIGHVAPLLEPVPPRLYGGTERVVAHVIEAQLAAGHEVTLFASGDSCTGARLVPGCASSLRLAGRQAEAPALHQVQLERVLAHAGELDVIHSHLEVTGLSLGRRTEVPVVTTFHGRLDLPGYEALIDEFEEAGVVSISEAQRAPLARARWLATVHHGYPRDLFRPGDRPGDYLAFVGRISPEKGLDRAIEIARAVGLPLRIAAKVDPADRDYFEDVIAPRLGPDSDLVGEVDDRGKQDLLAGARALLFPIDWPEPFGLVLIEALACGTPVVAMARGSVPEIVDDGVTGFVCRSLDEAIARTREIEVIDRAACRAAFEDRFTVERMAGDYERVYQRLVARPLTMAS